MTDLTVGTKDLRQALQAVVAHASTHPDETTFNRVRLVVGPVNLMVFATQGFTAGLSIVSVVDNADGEAGAWDMPPSAVKDLLQLFPLSKDTEEDANLRFVVDAEHVTCTDVSGLFPGKSVTLPRLPDHDYYPDVPGVLGQARAEGNGQLVGPVATTGPWWSTIAAATKAYKKPILITAATTGGRTRLLINVGDSFIGMLTTSADEDRITELVTERDAWRDRLPSTPRWTRHTGDPDPQPGEGDRPDLRTATGFLRAVEDDEDGDDQ